jgi:hypothetical protein
MEFILSPKHFSGLGKSENIFLFTYDLKIFENFAQFETDLIKSFIKKYKLKERPKNIHISNSK